MGTAMTTAHGGHGALCCNFPARAGVCLRKKVRRCVPCAVLDPEGGVGKLMGSARAAFGLAGHSRSARWAPWHRGRSTRKV
jgi:hypothetical protein